MVFRRAINTLEPIAKTASGRHGKVQINPESVGAPGKPQNLQHCGSVVSTSQRNTCPARSPHQRRKDLQLIDSPRYAQPCPPAVVRMVAFSHYRCLEFEARLCEPYIATPGHRPYDTLRKKVERIQHARKAKGTCGSHSA